MPAIVYRGYFRAHGLKSLERDILGFAGIAPVHETLIGRVDTGCRSRAADQARETGRAGRLKPPRPG